LHESANYGGGERFVVQTYKTFVKLVPQSKQSRVFRIDYYKSYKL